MPREDDTEVAVDRTVSFSRSRPAQNAPSPEQASAPGGFHHILVCLDRSAVAEQAIAHAVALGRASDARLTLLHILDQAPHDGMCLPADPFEWQMRREEGCAYLKGLAADSIFQGLTVGTEVAEGRAAAQIQAWAASHRVDLTVLTRHGEGDIDSRMLGGTARKLVDGLEGSLLVVPTTTLLAREAEAVRFSRILVPLDGSPHSEAALPVGLRLARAHDARLLLVHALGSPGLVRVGPLSAEDLDLERKCLRRNELVLEAYLAKKRDQLNSSGVSTRSILVHSPYVHDALLRIIRAEAADLIVLSARGASGHADRCCGSVTHHLLAQLDTPSLIVRERGVHATRAESQGHRAPRRKSLSRA